VARPGLSKHRKFRRLARALGDPLIARGALELLWEGCYENGDDYVGTAEDIEVMIGWQGESGELTRALVEAGHPEGYGFIDPMPDEAGRAVTYRVHDLWHHAPDYVAKRRKREMARQDRQDPAPDRRTAPNGGQWIASPASLPGVDRTPSPSPSPTRAPSGKSGSAAPQSDASPAVLVFPVVGRGSDSWALTESAITEWQDSYSTLNIHAEAQKALAWVKANSSRRKTARGMPAFLVNWFNRATNRGPAQSPGQSHRPAPVHVPDFSWEDECRELHGGRCGNRHMHAAEMDKAAAS
jgi:hypothetical protein